ncbi:MAG: hypothetical protein ACLTTO_01295 [Lachnospiraceae bacterium]
MDEFIKLLDPAYELIQYRIKEDKVIFHIASTITELECPFCGRKTSKVHSIYEEKFKIFLCKEKGHSVGRYQENAMYESGLFS